MFQKRKLKKIEAQTQLLLQEIDKKRREMEATMAQSQLLAIPYTGSSFPIGGLHATPIPLLDEEEDEGGGSYEPPPSPKEIDKAKKGLKDLEKDLK